MRIPKSYPERWLWLAVFALAMAGLYSLVPVVGRTPQLKSLGVAQELFNVALVVHVNLSVMVWSFAILGMALHFMLRHVAQGWQTWLNMGWWAVAASAVLMTLSPFAAWIPIKSNYIPVLHNLPFMLSLGLLLSGLVLTFIPALATYATRTMRRTLAAPEICWISAACAALLGLVAYLMSGYLLPPGLPLEERYEMLFWAGGHIMQFCFTLMVMAAWLTLLASLGAALPGRRWVALACAVTLFCALTSAAGFALYPFDSGEFTQHQTRVMNALGGFGASLVGLLVIARLLRTPILRAHRAYGSSLVVSLVLFFAGGVLGLMIAGQNVTIPAHYHGMIVGITQALMGLAYAMLPRFGYQNVAATRLAFWQPVVYGVGQMMHIGGLAYCGGYGILRKTAGGFENLAPDIKIALGIFGLGGVLAIAGGILFVVVMLRARRA